MIVVCCLAGLAAYFATFLCVASVFYPATRGREMNAGDVRCASGCALAGALAVLLLEALE